MKPQARASSVVITCVPSFPDTEEVTGWRRRGHTGRVPARFPVKVERFAARAPGDTGTFLDDLGMLEAPGSLAGRAGGLVNVEWLAGAGSFCLLGEPGV